ncbi:MAG: c-type cytochrome [Chitinophagales bacterium]|nr:c-type cytochrome [Chitinophagales bacterium]
MDLRKFSFAAFLLLFLLIFNFSAVAEDAAATPETPSEAVQSGEKIFKANCASCHKVASKMVGPALVGAEKRWIAAGDYNGISGRDWLTKWIKNSQEVIKEGYPYANKIYNEYNKSLMTAFTTLTDEDVTNVLAYVEYAAVATKPDVKVTPVPTGPDYTLYILYALLGILLVLVIGLGSFIGKLGVKVLEREGLPIPVPVPFYRDKKLITTVMLVILIGIGYAAVNQAIDLGRQQGYAPEQPIKYSHALHAGLNQINCQYCHAAAPKSKHANIPSMNVCMNCHKGIQSGDVNGKYGRKEIAKIYASIGFDPNTLSYIKDYSKMEKADADKLFTEWLQGDEKSKPTPAEIADVLQFVNKPIEWVRIHNLPDHVYFNHSQHVTVAGLECQTCHGPIQEMETVYQFAPLSMGWCINCHRTNEVNFAGNKFYEDYQQLHESLKSGKIDKVTVETIGGTECQKCHY